MKTIPTSRTQDRRKKPIFELIAIGCVLGSLAGCPLENIKPPFPPKPGAGPSSSVPAGQATIPDGVARTDCADAGACREFAIEGDPEAVLPNNTLAPFRGFADPSLRFDPDSGDLWMSYSWLSVGAGEGGSKGKPVIDFIVTNHLAKSGNKGRTFEFVRKLNSNYKATHASNGDKGWMTHEVSAIGRGSDGNWQAMWIDYLDPYGPKRHGPAVLSYSSARSPKDLGDNSQPWIRGTAAPPVSNPKYDFSKQAGLGDCVSFMEPTLFADGGSDYLAANCFIFKGSRRVDLEKLWLFRKTGGEYRYIGALLDHDDARSFGGDRMEQAELARSRDGAIILLVTPQTDGSVHYGCFALEVESLDPPRMKRNPDGSLVVRHYFTDSASQPKGPGACTYDPESETGVIIVRRDFDLKKKPPRLRFSLMATGIHP